MDTVEKAMKQQGWKYLRADERTVVSGFATPRHYMAVVRHDTGRQTLLFLFVPLQVGDLGLAQLVAGAPPLFRVHTTAGHTSDQVARVCEILLRENYRMLLGNFERDPQDGEIRFRIALPFRDGSVTTDQVLWCLRIGLESADAGMREVQNALGGHAAPPPMEV